MFSTTRVREYWVSVISTSPALGPLSYVVAVGRARGGGGGGGGLLEVEVVVAAAVAVVGREALNNRIS